jgi:hypothetical protein
MTIIRNTMNSIPKNSIDLAWLIRRDSIEMTHISGASHIGSDLSAADAIAVLYFDVMKIDSEETRRSESRYLLDGQGTRECCLVFGFSQPWILLPGTLKDFLSKWFNLIRPRDEAQQPRHRILDGFSWPCLRSRSGLCLRLQARSKG